jgi:pre-60S factor REI1
MSEEKQPVLTCITCRLIFKESEEMRVHYKTDFHRFNLKRKVANLLPVTEEIFNKKLEEINAKTDEAVPKGKHHLKNKKQTPRGNKSQSQTNPNQPNPNQSTPNPQEPSDDKPVLDNGQDNVQKTEDEMIDDKIAAAPVLTLRDSLFDRHKSSDFESNLQYMTKNFGFFIPEIEFLKDLPGLITYLGQKISIGNTCIFCEKNFYSLDATRDHMRALSHCRMRWEDNEDEYNDYYDVDAVNKQYEAMETNTYVSQFNELVLVDKNKVIGHRALTLYYKQRPSNSAQIQLMTSLLQEHKKLAALERQQRTNMDYHSLNKRADHSLKLGMKNNNQARYRAQNPM